MHILGGLGTRAVEVRFGTEAEMLAMDTSKLTIGDEFYVEDAVQLTKGFIWTGTGWKQFVTIVL